MPVFRATGVFPLESGESLQELELYYEMYGRLSSDRDNVIWVAHAFTGSAGAQDWWPGMIGPGLPLDTNRYCVICANMPGSCYGSTGPSSLNPESGEPYGADFPLVTNRDIARAFDLLRRDLEIDAVILGVGGSMGGQQLLEWAVLEPQVFRKLCLLATNALHSPWGIAFNEAQRMAIEADDTFFSKRADAGDKGMEAARAIAMLSYRNYGMYEQTQKDPHSGKIDRFKAGSYQRYQGKKLTQRFNAWSYRVLSKAMDSQNVGRNRAGVIPALRKITAKTLVIGIASDLLFPVEEQVFIARHIPKARLEIIDSPYGHDGFLVETHCIARLLFEWLAEAQQSQTSAQTRQVSLAAVPKAYSALPGSESF